MMNNFTKRILSILLFCILSQFLRAQELPKVIPASPTAAALNRFAEIPVSYATGVPNISVPIYTIRSGKLQLPISLAYHASGIKVRDIPSPAGLGWALVAGGQISQTVLGKIDGTGFKDFLSADEIITARSQAFTQGDQINLREKLNRYMFDDYYDTQSDRYSYNINGQAGVFRFDYQNNALSLIPYRPIKFIPHSSYWEVLGEDGNQYLFEQSEGIGLSSGTWLMTKMISADRTDTIKLHYKASNDIVTQFNPSTVVSEGIEYTFELNNSGSGGGIPTLDDQPRNEIRYSKAGSNSTPYFPAVLEWVESADGKVVFDYVYDNSSLNKITLSSIKIFDKKKNIKIREAQLTHSYFGTTASNNLRRRLDAVAISGTTNSAIETTSFVYNTTPLPAYPNINDFSFHEDYWGYYNGSNSFSLIPQEFLPASLSMYGSNLNPDMVLNQACILKEVNSPTGGKTLFEYETNTGGNYEYNNSHVMGGLRVKKISTFENANAVPIVKTYEYDGVGAAPSIFKELFHYMERWGWCFSSPQPTNYFLDREYDEDKFIYLGSSLFTLNPAGSNSVLYSSVKEWFGEGSNVLGYNWYQYDAYPHDNPEPLSDHPKFLASNHFDRGNHEPRLLSQATFRKVGNSYQVLKGSTNSYTQFHQREFKTGFKLDRTRFYRFFGDFQPEAAPLGGSYPVYLNEFLVRDTKAYEDVSMLTQTINFDYSDTDHPVNDTTNYHYDNLDHMQVTRKDVTTSNRGTISSLYKYPHDHQGTSPYAEMVNNRHIWNAQLEENRYRNGTTDGNYIGGNKTTYKDWGNGLLEIGEISTKGNKINDPWDERIKFLSYNNAGNITAVSRSGGPSISYIWGYSQQHAIAEIKNASSSDVAYSSFERGNEKGGWVYNDTVTYDSQRVPGIMRSDIAMTGRNVFFLSQGNNGISKNGLDPAKHYIVSFWYASNTGIPAVNGTLKKDITIAGIPMKYAEYEVSGQSSVSVGNIEGYIDELRLLPEGAQVTTYTYEPLIGMTSMTDAKGETTRFEYDSFQRLWRVKDSKGKVVKQYCYNYAGQQSDCTVIPLQPDPPQQPQSTIYVRMEASNVTFASNNGSPEASIDNMDTFADLKIKFYSNAECTLAYTLTQNMDLDISWTYGYSDQYGQDPGTPYTLTYTAQSGQNELNMGNWQLKSISTYNDPWYGTIVTNWRYDFQVVQHGGSNYNAVGTIGWYY